MKKIFILLTVFFCLNIFSQEDKLGGTPIEGIISIKRDINQQKNSVEINNSDNQFSRRPEDPIEIDPDDPIDIDPVDPDGPGGGFDPTSIVNSTGVTQGNLSVSLSGGATYSIPISVPPGINGVVPQIGLSYNSQGGNGMAGFGWNLSGVSVITRIPSTKFHDNTIDAADFDSLDRFAFDGQRLMLKNGNYGGDNAEYQTENFSTIKITSHGVSTFGTNFGPAYFLVEYPDGSKAYYGQNINSCSKTDWAITYWENPQGVRISYEYILDNNFLIVSKIKYGSTSTNLPINEIEFIYKSRLRKEESFVGGESFINGKILSEIRVKGNGVKYRNYVLAHNTTAIGYERLISITEKTGDNSKSLAPTIFSYDDTVQSGKLFNLFTTSNGMTNIRNTNTGNINGDFDGDGKIDMILFPISSPYGNWTNPEEKEKYWLYTDMQGNGANIAYQHNVGKFQEIFPISWLGGSQSYGYKLMPEQGWCIVKTSTTTNLVNFSAYSRGITNPVLFQYSKEYSFPKFTYGYWRDPCGNIQNNQNDLQVELQRTVDPNDPNDPNDPVWVQIEKVIPKAYLNGDFNGDGLSDVIAIEKKLNYQVTYGCSTYTVSSQGGRTFFVDLDRRLTSNFVFNSGSIPTTDDSKFFVVDYNGDGKSDIMVIDSGVVKVYTLNDSNVLTLLVNQNNSGIKIDKTILIGDFNGDGKSDFVIPQQNDVDSWNFYFSNSKDAFVVKNSSIGVPYYTWKCDYTVKNTEVYHLANDFNGDGKTDILQFVNAVQPNNTCRFSHDGAPFTSIFRILENNISSTNQISFNLFVEGGIQSYWDGIIANYGIKRFPLMTLLDYRNQNNNLEFSLLIEDKLHTFNYKKDTKIDVLLKSITLGNGVKETITYKPLTGNGDLNSDNVPLFTPTTYTENYPNFDVKLSPLFLVVSKIENQSKNSYKKQLFGYYGAVTNLQGLGFLGFRSLLKTNWFNDDFTRVSNVSKHDILKRGVVYESYSVLNALYNFQNTPSNYISKSVMNYSDELLPNKVYKIKNISSISYNGLEGTSKEVSTVFDEYNNPTENTILTKFGSIIQKTDVTNIVYDNFDSSSPYIIGRINKRNTTSIYLADTLTSEALYNYNSNNLLIQSKKKGHLTDYITENNLFDSFGNIIQKKTTVLGMVPRVSNLEYDISGRFLTKSIDIEGLETVYAYNTSTGQLLTETNPYGLTSTYTYDVWMRKRKVVDYLGNKKTFLFQMINTTDVKVTTTNDEGGQSIAIFDDLGRETILGDKLIDGTWAYIKKEYDIYDRAISISEPYANLSQTPSQFSTKLFDEYNRLIQSNSFTGRITTVNYSGLTSTTNDGFKSVTTTKDATGSIVSLTDNGGTINFQHYPNGALKQTDYDGVITSIEQDGWGKKKKLTDPSAGIYEYEYNNWGEIKKEITPKGVTNYNYDDFGKLVEKEIVGDDTHLISYYNYDSSKLLSGITTSTSTSYSYVYDSFKRDSIITEFNPDASYQIKIEYDSFGRPFRKYQHSYHNATGKSSSKWVKNTYKNGYAWQVLDDVTNNILWQTNTVNTRGQLTGAALGNGIQISKAYDNNGYLTQSIYDSAATVPVNLITLNTVFESQRGNLTSRYNSLFAWNENFEYDTLDRLTEYTNERGQQVQQVYDDRGRITENNLGTYNYNGPVYRNSSIDITPEAEAYYRVREGIFFDTMEKETGWQNYYPSIITFDNVFSNSDNGGTKSLKIDNPDTTEKVIHSEVWVQIDNNLPTEYTYSAWVYSDSPEAEMFLFMKDASETGYFTLIDNVVTNTVGNWHFVSKTVLVPANIKSLNIRLDNNGQGKVWFDNVKIRKTSNPEVMSPAAKKMLISYNAFKSPVEIYEPGSDRINFEYNVFQNRSTMYYGSIESDKLLRKYRKHYAGIGSMEIKYNTQSNDVEFITYINGDAYTSPVLLKSDGVTQNYLYLHRDYLGSIIAISNQSGDIVEKRLFDAWGNIIKIQDANGNIINALSVLDRGYTGHEHLQSVGLIHMNGRLYDPMVHRFLQPDNNIQDFFNTQNYNRYGYVLNNPLKYSDPSGEFWHIVIGAAIGGTIAAIQGGNFGDIMKGVIVGAVAGYVGGGVSSLAAGGSFMSGTVASGFWAGAFSGSAGGLAGAFAGSATNTWLSGGSFNDGLGAGTTAAPMGIITGGLMGGVSGGLKALQGEADFWTGKSNYKVLGYNNQVNPITGKYDFSGTNWNVEAELELEFSRQTRNLTCTYHCKRSVDWFFLGGGEDQSINTGWFNRADLGGVNDSNITTLYRSAGYSVEEFNLTLSESDFVNWSVGQMNNNRIVQVGWQPDSSQKVYHASLISKIEKHIKNGSYRYTLMDPARWGNFSFGSLKYTFSVWRPMFN